MTKLQQERINKMEEQVAWITEAVLYLLDVKQKKVNSNG